MTDCGTTDNAMENEKGEQELREAPSNSPALGLALWLRVTDPRSVRHPPSAVVGGP